ncbi:MAG: ATP-binding cassette domain-containing protein [Alphaproteobacteria bacterium]|nr:ATP-binding cassette domain-containing protein [Alphaproteobacteria bacterium]
MSAQPLIAAEAVTKEFPLQGSMLPWRAHRFTAVENVSIAIAPGEVLGLVGESASGKSTLGRILLGLIQPSAGTVRFRGTDLRAIGGGERRAMRRALQIIFQDPYASLDPRLTIGAIVREGLDIHGIGAPGARDVKVAHLLGRVGLDAGFARRYPHELSGGQRQRVGIARALAVEPTFIVGDEPVSALDVSIRGQILALLAELRRSMGLSMLLISHDIGAISQLSDRIAVLYAGRMIEIGSRSQVLRTPRHPYTRALLAAIPVPDPSRRRAPPPALTDGASASPDRAGCVFAPRCPHVRPACTGSVPPLTVLESGHGTACLLQDELPPAA